MATTNIWQQFKSLLPEGTRIVVTIISRSSNNTSRARLRDGVVVTVSGISVGVGEKAFAQDGEVRGAAPDLPQYEAEV